MIARPDPSAGNDDARRWFEKYFAAALDTPSGTARRTARCRLRRRRGARRRAAAPRPSRRTGVERCRRRLPRVAPSRTGRATARRDADRRRYPHDRTLRGAPPPRTRLDGCGLSGSRSAARSRGRRRAAVGTAERRPRRGTRRFEQRAPEAATTLDHPRVVTLYERSDGRMPVSCSSRWRIMAARRSASALHAGRYHRRGGTHRRRDRRRARRRARAGDHPSRHRAGEHPAERARGVHRRLRDREGRRWVATRTGASAGDRCVHEPRADSRRRRGRAHGFWSLGVVLHEMPTGGRRFRSEGGEALVYAVRHDSPVRVDASRPDVPSALATWSRAAWRKISRAALRAPRSCCSR